MIEIKKKGRPKGSTKKAAEKKVNSKVVKKPAPEPIDDLDELEDIEDFEKWEKDLDTMSSDELDDENKRASIRARTEQAMKQRRLNAVAMGTLVERAKAMESIKTICQRLAERLEQFPDKMVPQVHKRTKEEIRNKLVKEIDQMKKDFINLIETGI